MKQPLISVLNDKVNPAQLKRPRPFTLVSSTPTVANKRH
jgi:hypothetical protein